MDSPDPRGCFGDYRRRPGARAVPWASGFIDTILASRAVVVAVRIAIIFAVVFVVLSVVALIARRQWLARVGPVEVEKVSGLAAENQRLEDELEIANQMVESLKRQAARSQQVIEGEQDQ
jgi:hypothetical protein